MSLAPLDIIGLTRWLCLITCFAGAAWLDQRFRRIPNGYWIAWVKPAVFLWALELLLRQADWTVWGTAAAAVALASTAVIGRPTLKDVLSGQPLDIIVSIWYGFGAAGLIGGAMLHGAANPPLEVLVGTAEPMAALWWGAVVTLVTVWLFDLGWRVRLIHGGADAKALMWVAILIPGWANMPLLSPLDGDLVITSPPSLSLLIWGAAAFLLIPPLMSLFNVIKGHVRGIGDLRLAWHATKVPLRGVEKRHVWILDEVIDLPDGSTAVRARTRAPSRTPTDDQLAAQIAALKELGTEEVWVTHKWPLLTILFPAIIPLMIWGDPFAAMLAPLLG